MKLDQAPPPTRRVGIRQRVSNVWNSRNRMVRLIILATTGLVLNCCCVIIPLSTKAHGLAAPSNVGVNAIATPASTTAQDPLLPAARAISANMELENNGGGTVACKDFNSPAAAPSAAHIQVDGSDKNGRSCQSLP